MKQSPIMKQAFFLFFILSISSISFTNCTTNNEEENQVIHNKSCTIAIEGMMCEKGCKTTVQNKLREMDGVINAEVDFELHQAYITYDANKVSAQDFINKINKIADGLYKSKLVEDKDIENAPVEMDGGVANSSVSVSTFSIEVPNLGILFKELIF